MKFDDWMLTKDKSYVPTDDSKSLRLLRDCWFSRDVEVAELQNKLGQQFSDYNTFEQMRANEFRLGRQSRDAEVAELRNDVKMLREFVKLLRDYIPASAVGNMTVQEALSATKRHDRS